MALDEIAMIRINADFNEVDYKGRIILYNVDEHKSVQVELTEGMRVILWDEEGEVEAVLEFETGSSGSLSDFLGTTEKKGSWRARLLPGTHRRS
jgi:hypothetical protein